MAHIHGGEATSAVENAADRQFGKEFDDIHILSNAQVAVILQVSARTAVNRDEELNEVYRKTQKYVERFNTMTNPEKDNQELVEELDNLQEYVVSFLLIHVVCKPNDFPNSFLSLSLSLSVRYHPFTKKQMMEKSLVYIVLKYLL